MQEIFKGWRRVVVIGTLLPGMLMFIAWVRSICVFDEVAFRTCGDCHYVLSRNGTLCWATDFDSSVRIGGWYRYSTELASVKSCRDPFESLNFRRVVRTEFAGVEFGVDEVLSNGLPGFPKKLHWCRVPYWKMILPLTLVPALLIVRARVSEKKDEKEKGER